MDLSVPPRPDLESDSESESSQAANDQSKPKPGGLSVVRPEILFGDNKVPSSSASNNSSASDPSPLSLLSNLSGLPQDLNPLSHLRSDDDGTTNTMKDAFKEVLKLYGFPTDTMENIMQNPCSDQGQGKQVLLHERGQQIRPVALWWSEVLARRASFLPKHVLTGNLCRLPVNLIVLFHRAQS